jgi:predicted cobalt transporter CbtA
VTALPVALLCGQQFWWALVVAAVAAVIEVIRFLRSPPFMRVRLPAAEKPVHRHE